MHPLRSFAGEPQIPQELLDGMPTDVRGRYLSARNWKERRAVVEHYADALKDELFPMEKNIEAKNSMVRSLEKKVAAWDEIRAVIGDQPKLQRLEESGYHKLAGDIRDGTVLLPVKNDSEALGDDFKWQMPAEPQIFVLQHDWASAFKNADDFSTGEFRIPYNDAVFEFRVSGHRLICCVGAQDGIPEGFIFYIETNAGWALCGYNTIENGEWQVHLDVTEICAPIFNMARDQIRAVCIALDAEVAVSDIVRAPHKLNAKRERAGKVPLYDFRVISLANRKSYSALPDHETAVKKRLHFVRGHWRHLEAHKTWIKWHLRGNPDLGFIEKEYRL